jgi:hypothetical protein
MPATAITTDLVDALHQAPQSGHADVADQRRVITVEGQGALRLARHRQVRRAAADDAGAQLQRPLRAAMKSGQRRRIVVESGAQFVGHSGEFLRAQAGQQQRATIGGAQNRRDLFAGLAFAEHGLGNSGPLFARPVDLEFAHAVAARRKAAPRR